MEELEIEENTLVIYLSDNGAITLEFPTNSVYPGNNGPLNGGKGTVYEGGIRVPCVMRWKGQFPEAAVSDSTAIHADIFSTCLDAAGVGAMKTNGGRSVRGISLLDHIKSRGRNPLGERTIFFELTGKVAVRKGRYKLVGKVESSRAEWEKTVAELHNTDLELYDLNADIGEKNNLKDSLPEVYKSMKQELIEYFETIRLAER